MSHKTLILVLLVFVVFLVVVAACHGNTGNTGGWQAVPDDDDDDTSESVWSDPTTGLMWQNGSGVCSDEYDQTDAESYCAGLSWRSYGGWRLPDIDELRSLIRGCAALETGGSCGVTDSCLSDSNCWNSSCTGDGCSGGPGQDGEYWPPEIISTSLGFPFWSSSPMSDESGAGWVWVVNFHSGTISTDSSGMSYYARCVR